MAITRKKKAELIAKYVDELNKSEAIIFTDFRGLEVPELEELRKKIREEEGSFAVVKNTLIQKALEEVGTPIDSDVLVGPTGVGFCHNNIPGVAKAITGFAKEHDLLELKGGMIGHQLLDGEEVKDLTKLPTLEVVRAELLGVLNASATQLVRVLNATPTEMVTVLSNGVRQTVNVLNAYAQKGEAEA